ncbi:hypothetical protein NBRC10512v2_004680 [Rhodotorula toruloides]
MPDDFWVTKRSEMNKLKEERNVIRSRLREGKGVRSELLKVSEDMRQRLGELAMGYVVLDYARYNFAIYLHERGVVSEYWWQALEEFAEGAAGGLSLYWPASARRECTEGAMITANFPRLTSLSSTPSSRSCFKAAHTHRYHSASSYVPYARGRIDTRRTAPVQPSPAAVRLYRTCARFALRKTLGCL